MTREERKNVIHCLKASIDEALCEECSLYHTTGEDHCEKDCVRLAIEELEQEPKTGHWTHDGSHWKNRFICTECNYKLFDEPTNYCPNCGCRMVEPQESEG